MNRWLLFFIILFIFSCSANTVNQISDNEQYQKYWSYNIEEIDLVMSYILDDYQDYKKIKKMNQKEKLIFLDNYFSRLDPDTTTVNNECLEELNKRVLTSKELFSSDRGIFSDRAKIYIIYGPPENEYESYRNKLKVFIWQYTIDNKLIEFQFINDTFGHYKLIIDDFNYINN